MQYNNFYENDKTGIMNIKDEIIFPAVYDYIGPLSDGLFNVRIGDKTAFYNEDIQEVLPFSNLYESYGDFVDGLAKVSKDTLYGFIDKNGKEVIKPQYRYVDDFYDGISIVELKVGDKRLKGAIDKTGRIIADCKYTNFFRFENGYAILSDENYYGLIDKNGTEILPLKYVSVDNVKNNKVTVQIFENDEYREGIYTIGGDIVWNNKLDGLNKVRAIGKNLKVEFEKMIDDFYLNGCPCEYERFRDFVQWYSHPANFPDQENLFNVFKKKLKEVSKNERNDITYGCEKCGTTYLEYWEQYSIALWAFHVQIMEKGNFVEKGAAIKLPIPMAIGFQGYDLDEITKSYKKSTIKELIDYLTETK